MSARGFSGSYDAGDVTFLLKPIKLPVTELAERERRIQSGQAHYSEMIGREAPPSPRYLALFRQSMELFAPRLARGLAEMAALVAASRPGPTAPVTLVSLVRAGTPVGVLLKRILERFFHRRVAHYSVSIIRDRGLDLAALRHILASHTAESVVFVDGWTAKGVIARELTSAVAAFAAATGTRGLCADLHVLTDLRGEEGVVATTNEDYLIPSCLLNAVVSGLISRSILNRAYLAEDDFHGCVAYPELAPHDLSRWFVDRCMDEIESLDRREALRDLPVRVVGPEEKKALREQSAAFIELLRQRYEAPDENFIKPGLGETTRVLLRREPRLLLLRSQEGAELAPLVQLAGEKKVPIAFEPRMPFKAAALIQKVAHA